MQKVSRERITTHFTPTDPDDVGDSPAPVLLDGKTLLIARAIEDAARAAGMTSPDFACRLIDMSRVGFGEDGEILGVEAAVSKLTRDRPGYFTRRPGGGTPPRSKPDSGGPGGGAWARTAGIRQMMISSGRYSKM